MSIWHEDIRIVVLDKEWQELRVSFLGTWKAHADKNVLALRAFLQRRTDDRALRCVYNYLTGSMFRTRNVVSAAADELLAEVRKEVTRRKG